MLKKMNLLMFGIHCVMVASEQKNSIKDDKNRWVRVGAGIASGWFAADSMHLMRQNKNGTKIAGTLFACGGCAYLAHINTPNDCVENKKSN